jgi:hypothetical protein
MRTLAITSILAFTAAGAVQAATSTIPINGSGTFQFSAEFLNAASVAGGDVTYTPPVVTIPEQPQSFSAFNWSSVTVDQSSKNLLSLNETGGGGSLTISALKSVSSGGSVTVTDLSLDLVNKQVKATLIGANGVGTLTDFALWNIDPNNALPMSYVPGMNASGTITGLSITSDGFAKVSQALGLLTLGKSALMGVTDYASISWRIAAVPEASTWAMTLLGLGAIGAAVQRRRQQA